MHQNVIRICGFNYPVIFEDGRTSETLEEGALAGCIMSHPVEKIVIDSQISRQKQSEVMMHEVMHGVDISSSPKGLKEKDIRRLSRGLVAVFRENPGLLEFVSMRDLDSPKKKTHGRGK